MRVLTYSEGSACEAVDGPRRCYGWLVGCWKPWSDAWWSGRVFLPGVVVWIEAGVERIRRQMALGKRIPRNGLLMDSGFGSTRREVILW